MCNLFNSYEESLHLCVCKLAKYVRDCVVFWKNLHSWQKFYTTVGRDGRDKFQVWKEICLMAWAVDKIESNFLRWLSTWGAQASHPKCPTSRIFPTTLWKKISTRDSTCRLNHLTSEWSIFPRLQTSYYYVPLLMRESHFECGHKDCSGTTTTQQSNFIFLLAA